jgi:hypothetical protein
MTDKPFAQTAQFYGHLGWFYAVWSATELNIDLTIGKLLKLPPEQTHALLAGLQFGRKAALLRSLLTKSDYPNVPELKGFLTRIRTESLRNVFSHSFIFSDIDSVTFVHRRSQDEYSADGYKFKADGFVTHVKNFLQLAHDFEKALAIPHDELLEFARAALRSRKPKQN